MASTTVKVHVLSFFILIFFLKTLMTMSFWNPNFYLANIIVEKFLPKVPCFIFEHILLYAFKFSKEAYSMEPFLSLLVRIYYQILFNFLCYHHFDQNVLQILT